MVEVLGVNNMKECWICRRTEEDFKRILKLDDSEDMDDFFYPADLDDETEDYEQVYGSVNICPVCFQLDYVSGTRTIQWIEGNHSDLFEWFNRVKTLNSK